MATKRDLHKIIIGKTELLSFVDLDLKDIPAKTDTGAGRSAVHASNIKLDADGTLSFDLLAGHFLGDAFARHIETKDFRVVTIENSFGQSEERYEVKMRAKIGPKTFMTRFTLANRSKKACAILIGCNILDDRFLVDTSQSSVNVMQLREQYGLKSLNYLDGATDQ